MSAIAGIYHMNKEPVSPDHSNGLMKSLRKYPADDVQIWKNHNVFLGCHAQWITPESVGERLPFYDSESRLVITSDAIIDNRKELFDRLQVDRSCQKQMTDSELILRAYQKWGEVSPKYLVGDFAYMIWDERNQKLFGARDFSGARTLYYYHDGQRFVFCTTMMPLFTLPYLKKELNEEWLAEYLAISGMVDAVDASLTPYKQIEQVPPSHSILITKNRSELTRYCTLTSGKRLNLKSNKEYEEAFQEVFQTAVTSRIRTHCNVGAELSGGLDSGSVVSFARKALHKENKKLYTFSYIPPDDFQDFTPKSLLADERPYIKETVKHVGGIKDSYLDFQGRDSFSEIDDLLDLLEMPYKFFENSFWLKGMFEKAHEKGARILLNGARGNFTISWGYAMDYYAVLLKRVQWFLLFQELKKYSANVGGARFRRLPQIARVGFPILNKWFPQGKPYKLPTLINQEFANRTKVYEKFKEVGINQSGWYPAKSVFEERKRHFQDLFQWHAGNTFAAKLSLRYSLSARDPTNDLRVIRFCLSVPEGQYVQQGLDRSLIRRATRNDLPDKVRLNQRYRGVQGADWVHRMAPYWDHFIEELHQMKADSAVMEFMDGKVIEDAISNAESGPSPEKAIDPEFKILMRSLIVYRFIKRFV